MYNSTWVRTGRYYGYPECYIQAFCNASPKPNPDRKFKGTGFVPCDTCNSTKSEKELVEEVSARRKCLKPFPLDFYS